MKNKKIILYINYLVIALSALAVILILIQCSYFTLIAMTISILVLLAMIISNVMLNSSEKQLKIVLNDRNKRLNDEVEDVHNSEDTSVSSNTYLDLVKNLDNSLDFGVQLEQKIIKLADSIQLVASIVYERKEDLLELSSCYALAKSEQKGSLRLDEGMTGQVVKDKKPFEVSITDQMSLEIVSGLGKSKPNYLYILPIFEEEEVIGVAELATFVQLNSKRVEFLIEALRR
jgi:hypothetical protein